MKIQVINKDIPTFVTDWVNTNQSVKIADWHKCWNKILIHNKDYDYIKCECGRWEDFDIARKEVMARYE